MGDFNGHHTLWGCEDVNNRSHQLEDLILKNYLILLNDKSHTYFHSASGTFTSIDLFSLTSPGKLSYFLFQSLERIPRILQIIVLLR